MWTANYGNIVINCYSLHENMIDAPVIKFKDTGDGIKIGSIIHRTGSTADFEFDGFTVCRGQGLDKVQYSDLYNVLGDFYTNYAINVYGKRTHLTEFKVPLDSYFITNVMQTAPTQPQPQMTAPSLPPTAKSIIGRSLCDMLHSHLNLCDTDLYGVIGRVNRGGHGIPSTVFGEIFELKDILNPIYDAEWYENGILKSVLMVRKGASKNYTARDLDAISERIVTQSNVNFPPVSIHQVYNGGNRLARTAIVPNVVDFNLDFVANDLFKPKKTCACECGAWAAGHTSHSRSHSSWCPLYKE
jgi:hypothetical protein